GELVADRATLAVQYQRTEPARTESEAPPTSVRRPAYPSSRPPSLSEEVERILSSHRPQRRPPTPAPGSYRSSRPSVEHTLPPERTSEVQRSARPVAPERTSEVQPVAPRSAPPDHEASPAELKRSKG
ncbi:MAG TPA: hypothetical protein VEQ59_06950, partial [Polyangiaceae bacterium]|nr:hypothetical protein [Polyangiaceae bacterium]